MEAARRRSAEDRVGDVITMLRRAGVQAGVARVLVGAVGRLSLA